MPDPSQQTVFPFPVLVVDDNLLLRTMLESNLKAAGYQVVTAENGRQALEIFRTGYYPIVMTDWVMPEMDGLELCRAIRSDDSGRYTYVVLLTSQNSKNDIITGLEAGADEYLIKPAHQAELVTRLKTARRILDLEGSLKKALDEVKSLSLVDPLTGIFNRRYMDERLPVEIMRAYRYERSLSLILVSINKFREVTGTHGYFVGDLVLKGCADCIAESIRQEVDWLARYGEEQFMVMLPETDAAGAVILAKRLRIRIGSTLTRHKGAEIKVSASFGVAGFTATKEKTGLTSPLLLEQAHSCLHQALTEGGEAIKGVQLG